MVIFVRVVRVVGGGRLPTCGGPPG